MARNSFMQEAKPANVAAVPQANSFIAAKPANVAAVPQQTGYVGSNADALAAAREKVMGRQPFSYNAVEDPMYQQYKDRYIQQGKQAMEDSMAQAAAMTGGYGSSYGQAVGQQTYQGYMQGLNDKADTLYQIALDKYTREGNQLMDQLQMLQSQDDTEYGRWAQQQQWDRDAAWRAEDLARQDQQRAEDLAREDAAKKQSDARSQVDAMLATGKKPSEALRKKSGYSKQYINAMYKQWQRDHPPAAAASGGGGGSGSGSGADLSLAAAQAMERGATDAQVRDNLIKAGASQQEADAAILKGRNVLTDATRASTKPR